MASVSFTNALSEITLVLFTTLAPAGAFAFLLMSLPLIKGNIATDLHARTSKAQAIPLIASLVGLVASATHLGSPANALYVLTGVGRSPLSNEVFFAVLFLSFAGIYWLYSFSLHPRIWLGRVLLICSCISACIFITAVAFAYSAPTIISWNTLYTPISLWLSALIAGPLMAIVGLRVARWKSAKNNYGRAMLYISSLAFVLCVIVYIVQGIFLHSIENSYTFAYNLVPGYELVLILFSICVLVGILLDVTALFKRNTHHAPQDEMTISILRASIACVIALLGIFMMRFVFYMFHMTAGMSF